MAESEQAFCDEPEDDGEPEYWLCPYLARWYGWERHDPLAVCAFTCDTEPVCVTFGPWSDEQMAEAMLECKQSGPTCAWVTGGAHWRVPCTAPATDGPYCAPHATDYIRAGSAAPIGEMDR